MKFENRVQRYQHLFTKTDKRIVNYIRQNGYSDAFSTINSLAHAIDPLLKVLNLHNL